MGYSRRKRNKGMHWGYTFLKKNPEFFRFVTLVLEIQRKTSFHYWKFCKIVWNSYEVPWPITHRAIPEKKRNKGVWGHTILKVLLEFLGFLLYPWKFRTKQSFTPRSSTKLCYTPQKLQVLKPRPLGILNNFLLITPGSSTLFLINL